MYIAILGRQPALGMAELEAVYGAPATRWFSDQTATVAADTFSIDRLGGTQKAGQIVAELRGDWHQVSMKIVQQYSHKWVQAESKITLGISAYGFAASPRDVQKTGIILKQKLKSSGTSLRLIPNPETALNTATSHHNKLGLSPNKVELLVVRQRDGKVIIAESIGAQNITAYTKRDQQRPKRDTFVGMLPPKLAQIMINLATQSDTPLLAGKYLRSENKPTLSHFVASAPALMAQGGATPTNSARLLDPFCGTGVILQEAALFGYQIYGTDLSEKMVDYSRANLDWLAQTHQIDIHADIHQADARTTEWQPPIDTVACESYLGQPFSAPPSPSKLAEVRNNCDHIISQFLQNIAGQLQSNTPLCIAVPAWRDVADNFTHLPSINNLESLGFTRHAFKNVKNHDLIYFRPDQIVARELLVLTKT